MKAIKVIQCNYNDYIYVQKLQWKQYNVDSESKRKYLYQKVDSIESEILDFGKEEPMWKYRITNTLLIPTLQMQCLYQARAWKIHTSIWTWGPVTCRVGNAKGQ